MTENGLSELAELLRELEETLLKLRATKNLERRRLVRKISRLFAEIERNRAKMSRYPPIHVE
jgi:hypothetical protein